MKKLNQLVVISIATILTSASARADDADASQFAGKFETNRTRAEVASEAAEVSKNRNLEPAGSRYVDYKSTASREAVRAQAIEAVRMGRIPSGEAKSM